MLFLFRFTKHSDITINNWYDKLGWTSIILDILSIIIGFYLAKYLYLYLVQNNYISPKNEIIYYLSILLCIQILHDLTFYFYIIKPTPKGVNDVIDEFKKYAKQYRINAVIADSLIYIVTTPLLYYYISKQNTDNNIFTTIVCIYIIGYLLHQKPKYLLQ
tara:strand:- start:13 stop:492 length:480 start_codon:yes stop_codon:yes gene_type:complete